MYHDLVVIGAKWIAPIVTGAFCVVLPVLFNRIQPGHH